MICIAAMNCALSVRKSAARLHSTTINPIALYIGLRCRITLNAATTASAARPRKRMWENSITDSQEQDSDRRSQDDVEERRRQQHLPSEIHQLVVAETRQRPAQPDVEEQEEEYFRQEPDRAQPRDVFNPRPVPPAQEQRRRQHRNGHHIDVLGHEEEREFERAVFGMKPGDQLGLGLGQIEGHAVGLGDGADKINGKGDDAREEHRPLEDVPVEYSEPPRLLLDYFGQIERARLDHHGDDRKRQRQLITDHLRRRAQSAEQAVFRIRRPTADHDAVYAKAGHREDVQQPDVHVRDVQTDGAQIDVPVHPESGAQIIKGLTDGAAERQRDIRPERVDDQDHHRRNQHDYRRQDVEPFVDRQRDDVLFEDELEQVGEGLQQPLPADAVRPQAVLDDRQHTPFGIYRVGDNEHDEDPEDGDLHQRADDVLKINRIE